jgi:nicotinamide riboside kinase
LRIALIGNASTGKTTLANELSRRLNLPLVSEFAREIVREWRDSGVIQDFSTVAPAVLADLQDEIVRRKEELELRLPSFVADRTTADALVIWLVRLAGRIDEGRFERFAAHCRRGIGRYDRLYLLPTDAIPFEPDEIRQARSDKRFLFDVALVGLLQVWGCSYKTVRAVSLEERLGEILFDLENGGMTGGRGATQ